MKFLKASVEEVTIIQEKVTTVQENMVTKTEVETIVKTEVQEVVSNDDFVKDVESIIVNQITEEGDVHQAITAVVEKTVGDIPVMSDEEAVEIVDDIFANF